MFWKVFHFTGSLPPSWIQGVPRFVYEVECNFRLSLWVIDSGCKAMISSLRASRSQDIYRSLILFDPRESVWFSLFAIWYDDRERWVLPIEVRRFEFPPGRILIIMRLGTPYLLTKLHISCHSMLTPIMLFLRVSDRETYSCLASLPPSSLVLILIIIFAVRCIVIFLNCHVI